jgi:hypothetical protein
MSDEYSTPTAPNSTLAIVSLVSGILGWTLAPLLGSIVAVITGHMAKNEIKASGGAIQGDGLATAGLILGYLSLGLALVGCLCVLGAVMFFGFTIPAFSEFSNLLTALLV